MQQHDAVRMGRVAEHAAGGSGCEKQEGGVMEKLFLRSYYHDFLPTGERDVDLILQAIAVAGKSYHNTSQWDEAEPSHWSNIQNAANDAANALRRAHAQGVQEGLKMAAEWWEDTEARASEAHSVYQSEAHRRGDVRHPDLYRDLSEETKEWDRVLVRWVAGTLRYRAREIEDAAQKGELD